MKDIVKALKGKADVLFAKNFLIITGVKKIVKP